MLVTSVFIPWFFQKYEIVTTSASFSGQMMSLTDKRLILYLCSPYVETLDDLEERGFHISDLPTHDVTKYLLPSTLSAG